MCTHIMLLVDCSCRNIVVVHIATSSDDIVVLDVPLVTVGALEIIVVVVFIRLTFFVCVFNIVVNVIK
jgi:hypothetical protein